MKTFTLRAASLCALLFGAAPLAGAASYSYTDLGELGSSQSRAAAINNGGQVVGTGVPDGGLFYRGLLWNNAAQPTDLGTLPGTQFSPVSWAYGVNDAGAVVGTSSIPNSNGRHATLWSGGGVTDLGVLGGFYSQANAINSAGQIAGSSSVAGSGNIHAALWSGGGITDLGVLGGTYSSAAAINNAGQAVGMSTLSAGSNRHAVLWSGGAISDLGTLGGSNSTANDINNAGQIVGSAGTTGNLHTRAVLWSDGTATELLTETGGNSYAAGIDNAGQVVGAADSGSYASQRAYLWDGTIATDLNIYLSADLAAEGWVLQAASGINDSGAIVGVAFNTTTLKEHAFLLTVSAVPEPQTYAMLLLGWD